MQTEMMQLFDLAGKRALITGSGQGIGLALASGLGRAGAAVVLNGRHPDKLEQAVQDLRARGMTAETGARCGCTF
jgi:gluconate 5-dehydrogenase